MGKARQRPKMATRGGKSRQRAFSFEGLEARRLLSSTAIGLDTQNAATPMSAGSTTTVGIQGYSPSQVASAYGFSSSVATSGATGAGQTIAIVEAYHSKTIVSDLDTFDQEFDLPNPSSLTQVNELGGTQLPGVNSTWSQETALDVEWAHAVAPGANIVIVEASSDRLVDLLAAVDAARRIASVSVVSISWGVNEFANETDFDYLFTAPAGHQNITFVASSGENSPTSTLQWPAVSPNVVSVGGSTLTLATSDGITALEAPWTATDSGTSQYEPAPVYQETAMRGVPDVVYDANPSTGFAVYDSGDGGWVTLGGTSAGAPQWAALIAISDQIRANNGQSTLNGSTQTLPQLYSYYGQNTSDTLDFTSTAAAGGTTTTVAGTLVASNGASLAAQVINSLAATDTIAAPPAATAPATSTKAPPPAKARPFVQPTLKVTPTSVLSAAGFGSSSAARSDLQNIASSAVPLTEAATSQESSLAISGATSSAPVSTAMLNGAFSASTAPIQFGSSAISEAFAGLFVVAPGVFGQTEVVPVGAELSQQQALPAPYYFIAHINAATELCDAVSAFINECATGSPPVAVAGEPPQSHLRAWAITGAVTAIDLLVLHHLVMRRRRAPKARWRDGEQTAPELVTE